MPYHILAIESSCDETAAALFRDDLLLSEYVANQEVHALYGGVVPEFASRAHQTHIVPVVDRVFRDAGLPITVTTHLACTQGPGLIGALLVGTSFVQGMGLSLDLPIIPIHHIKAHLLANFIEAPSPTFPFLGLVVSGGHTQLVWVEGYHRMTLLGQTLDDAVGEAYDKIAKLLGFPYPGGVHVDRHAQRGDPKAFAFPITRMPKLDYSFSGIKTAVLYFLRERVREDKDFIQKNLNDLCASVQYAMVTMIAEKVLMAMEQTGTKQLVIGGGVAANSALQECCRRMTEERGCTFFSPSLRHCQDNAAMIGMAAYHVLQEGFVPEKMPFQPMARMPI